MKIGIFGGSFNPIHQRHEQIACFLLKQHCVDKIIFVPTGEKYSYKSNLCSATDRYEMIKLVTDKYDDMEVSDYELKKSVVYTWKTLDYFAKQNINDDIYFICGSDNLDYIDTWKNSEYILNNYKFLVVNRRGNDIASLLIKYKKYSHNIIDVQMELDDLSSTLVRDKIKNEQEVSSYLDKNVLKYIEKHGLYRKNDD